MVNIHPSALVHPKAQLGIGVNVGAFTIIGEHVTIGDGTSIGSHCVIEGHTTIGRDNNIHHYAALGGVPQDKKYNGEPTRLEIGDRNTIREFVSFNVGTIQDKGVTTIGSDNWVMGYVHVAHDCRIGNQTILASNAQLAGHCEVGDWAILGGHTGYHQFVRIGAHAMIGGGSMLVQDVPPFVMAQGYPTIPRGINAEGLKRRGYSSEAINAIKQAYRAVYKSGLSMEEARLKLDEIQKTAPEVAILNEFLASSQRGIYSLILGVFVTDKPLKFALVAGEASGDVLGASLIQALKARYPDAEFLGIGGPKMIAAGLRSEYDQEKLAVRGAAEVLSHLPEILSIRRGIVSRLKAWRPNVFIGIDAPDFNLTVERKLKASGIPTVHYVSPTVWAWRRGRTKKIVAAVNQLLCLFPFEPACYSDKGLKPVFVGHPLADEIDIKTDRALVRQSLKLPEASPLITLMPGSRQSELVFHAGLFVDTANRVAAELPDALFLVPLATPETRQRFEETLKQQADPALRVKILYGHAREALAASDLALVCSGTATLEAALLRCPMVITYRVTAISAWIYRKMRYLTWVGLPNILLGRLLVQELLQEDATPEKLSTALIDLWRQPNRRREMEASFAAIHTKLRQNSAERAADAVIDCLKSKA